LKGNDKIKLIYILGTGHNGSTILDLLIGSSKEVFTTGELFFYNLYKSDSSYKKTGSKYLCTCKKEFIDCDFWKKIISAGDFKIKKNFSIYENLKISILILLPFIRYNKKKFTDESYELLNIIKSNTNNKVKYILDSSKDPRRLFYLMNDQRIDILPMLLIRDARAVAHSYNNKIREKYNLKRENVFLNMIKWFVVNYMSKRVIKRAEIYLKFTYEEFCININSYIEILNDALNINISKKNYIKEINEKKIHNIGGNIMRFNKLSSIKINENWKAELSIFKKIIIFPLYCILKLFL
jgi:hypothetical protein